MNLKKWTYRHLYPRLGRAAILILSSTLHIYINGYERVRQLRKRNEKIVFVLWHGRQMMASRFLARDKTVCAMTSTSRDGRLQSRILQKFGFDIVFGSSNKSSVRALVGVVKKMQHKITDVAMAVDGPQGPIYKVKPGAVFLAKKMNAFIVPVTFASHPALTLRAWDQYQCPLPFSKTAILYGKPYKSSPDLNEEAVQAECLRIEEKLNELTRKAENRVYRRHAGRRQ